MELNGTILIQIAIFLTLLLVLSKSLFRPMMRLFEERERRMVGAKNEALALQTLALQKAKEFEDQIARAEENAKAVMSSMKNEAQKHGQMILDEAKLLAKERLHKADEEISKAEKDAKKVLQGQVDGLSEDVVRSLFRKDKKAPFVEQRYGLFQEST